MQYCPGLLEYATGTTFRGRKKGDIFYLRNMTEFSRLCTCADCVNRAGERLIYRNGITVSTNKRKNMRVIEDFLELWVCENGKVELPPVHYTYDSTGLHRKKDRFP